MIRNPLVIEYCPRTEFHAMTYSEAFDTQPHSFSFSRRVPFHYQTREPIETDVFRKRFAVDPTSYRILEQYESLLPYLTKRYSVIDVLQDVNDVNEDSLPSEYASCPEYPPEEENENDHGNTGNTGHSISIRPIRPISYALIQWKHNTEAELIKYWHDCLDYIEMDMYVCIAKAQQVRNTRNTRNTSSTATPSIADLFPRVYQYNLMTRHPYVDTEALVDMILYTPYLYQTKQHCIQNQSSSYVVYTEDGKMIPYHEAIQYGSYRPTMYWNKKDNIGWRQSYDRTRQRFQTICFTRKTYDLFVDNMRDTIRWFHAHNLVYLDWNVRNIGYSEVDRRFKVFDFDAMARVVSEESASSSSCASSAPSSLIRQMRPTPVCRSFNTIYKDYTDHPTKYVSSTRRRPLTPYELDWNLFYTMLNEVIVV